MKSPAAGLPRALRGLLRPEAYPHAVTGVALVETHLSWVLIAGERAYKLKQPVRYEFVDQRRLEDRRRLCEEELRLNRRFAPQLYLEVCPIVRRERGVTIGGAGPAIEYAVVMRAFDRGEQLDRLVAARRISMAECGAFGRRLARLHEQLPPAQQADSGAAVQATGAAIARNARECAAASALFGAEAVGRIRAVADAFAAELTRCAPLLRQRRERSRIRECHGDLHLANVVRIDGELLPFDCLEFEPAFRCIDVAQDIAFLIADLESCGEPALAAAFLDAWLAESGDYEAATLLPLYTADRALVRAKIMAIECRRAGGAAAESEPLRHRHEAHLRVAEQALHAATPCCLMMSGLPGSGKSWLAARLAPALAAVTVRSDVERRRLAGIEATASSGSPPGGGLYDAAHTQAVYERIGACAGELLRGRRNVIVDANFGRRSQRAALAQRCAGLAVPLYLIECDAPLPLLRQRIGARSAAAADASEADEAVLAWQLAQREPITDAEQLSVIRANTASADVVGAVLEALRLLRA